MNRSSDNTKAYALTLLAGALVLVALSTAGLEGRLLSLAVPSGVPKEQPGSPVDRFGTLFSADPVAHLAIGGERRDVFRTSHFNKPPPPKPPPPQPKTKTISLTFRGTITSSDGQLSGFLQVDDAVKRLGIGTPIQEGWGVAGIDGAGMVVTNNVQTNTLPFRQTIQLTVPIP